MTRDGRRTQGGFTLIEVMVVVVIMSLVAGLVLVRQPWRSPGLDVEVTQRALTAALRLARSRAIAQGRDVAVVTGTGGFSCDGGVLWALPSGQALSDARVVFTPEGEGFGQTIVLAAPRSRIAVSVNWLTGQVRAEPLDRP